MDPCLSVNLRVLPQCSTHCGSSNKAHCGCRALDFVFSKPYSNCAAIRFCNEQSHSISLMCQSSDCSDWKVILWEYVLMPNPHTLGKSSESCFTLLADIFLRKVEDMTRLRVILRQPSPHWDYFGISNLTVVSTDELPMGKYPNLQHVLSGCLKPYEIDLLK